METVYLTNIKHGKTSVRRKARSELFLYRCPEQKCVCVSKGGVCAGAFDAPLRQPVQQQQQETTGANRADTHQDHLPQAGPVPPYLLHRNTHMNRLEDETNTQLSDPILKVVKKRKKKKRNVTVTMFFLLHQHHSSKSKHERYF